MCALQEIFAEMKRFLNRLIFFFVIEPMLFLNSLIEVPIAFPISGNLEGPKITRAITKINVEDYLNEQK